jgi:ABC-2 type transport system permease protein
MIVSMFLWHIGMWIRRERMLGTLESIYLTSAHRFPVLLGTTLYGTIRTLLTFSISFTIGCLIFGINPFQGHILIALAFLGIGMIPLFGMSLIFGAVIFKVKEAGALMNLAQWGVSLLMGLFFPITVLPPFLQACAYAFPPTWMTNGVRASLLDVSYFLNDWYLDFAVVWLFILVFPMLGWYFFMMTDKGMRESEGVGQF